jgi:hypothetical protein
MNIQLPAIDMSGLLPVAGLALIAVGCIAALLVRSLFHSHAALIAAVMIGVAATGPALAAAIASIVGALVPLAAVLVGGAVAVLYLLGRNPELMALARDVAPRKTPLAAPPLELAPPQDSAIVINQSETSAPRRALSQTTIIDDDRWGF